MIVLVVACYKQRMQYKTQGSRPFIPESGHVVSRAYDPIAIGALRLVQHPKLRHLYWSALSWFQRGDCLGIDLPSQHCYSWSSTNKIVRIRDSDAAICPCSFLILP